MPDIFLVGICLAPEIGCVVSDLHDANGDQSVLFTYTPMEHQPAATIMLFQFIPLSISTESSWSKLFCINDVLGLENLNENGGISGRQKGLVSSQKNLKKKKK